MTHSKSNKRKVFQIKVVWYAHTRLPFTPNNFYQKYFSLTSMVPEIFKVVLFISPPCILQGNSMRQNKTKMKSNEIAVEACFLSY